MTTEFSTNYTYQTNVACFARGLNDQLDIAERLAQGVGGIFRTVQYAYLMHNSDHVSSRTCLEATNILAGGITASRTVCDLLQLPSGDAFFEVASENTTVETDDGDNIQIRQGELMRGKDGGLVHLHPVHTVAKAGSMVGRGLGTVAFFNHRAYTLPTSTSNHLTTAAIFNGFITAGAWLGVAVNHAYKYVQSGAYTVEKTVCNIVACVRSLFDVISHTFDVATYQHVATNPVLGLVSAILSAVTGLFWFGSEAAMYKRAW
ncbi:MAG: hypothetical protein JSS62_05435 [Verrucomicrobia bacterium]|nr:hypothetical protein [Verrucomicrobiota bacterium]MBS0646158.1 hypothetical protein [Verrucomicrobiota bacterium]